MKKFLLPLPLLFCITISALAQDATAFYDAGVKLKNDGDISGALKKFTEATRIKPDYTAAFYEIGWCSNDLKDYPTAIAVLRKVVPVWTDIPKCFFELGYAFDKTLQTDSAVYYYNKCLALKSDYSSVYKQLGYIAFLKDDYTAAIDNFIKYETYTKNPITDYLFWYREGFSGNATKDYALAKTALLKALSLKTDYTNIYLELGFACTKMKEADEAIGYFKKAIELEPKSHIGYNGVAEVYRDVKKDIPEALSWYQKVLTMNPDERKANFGMGYCLNSAGKNSEAISYLKKAIEMEPTYTAAYVELGYSYYMTRNNDDALINLDKAINLNSKNENARYYKGLIYISQNDKTKAQQMVNELQTLNSKNAATLQEKVSKM